MSILTDTNGSNDDTFAAKGNGQLPTPALSPILEHHEPVSSASITERVTASEAEELRMNRGTLPGPEFKSDDESREERSFSNATSPRLVRLPAERLHDLVLAPESLPVRSVQDRDDLSATKVSHNIDLPADGRTIVYENGKATETAKLAVHQNGENGNAVIERASKVEDPFEIRDTATNVRPTNPLRSVSTPLFHRKHAASKSSKNKPELGQLATGENAMPATSGRSKISPVSAPQTSTLRSGLPIPPLSLPTYLQLELSSDRPSALYIHQTTRDDDAPYESSKVKFERLTNFLLLPPHLEQVLIFGTIACLDAWLYTFTILPLRFLKAVTIFSRWLIRNAAREIHDIGSFVYSGVGRVRQRRRQSSVSVPRRPSMLQQEQPPGLSPANGSIEVPHRPTAHFRQPSSTALPRPARRGHRRTRSTPSALLPNHKADMLQGLLIITSCTVLMWFDASRMYHSIRGQAAIKLYVIYNVLEVFDRLFAALGQDVLECLFSKETLERDEHGRSKVLRPLWMFGLALIYNVIHATALFYQVITLNVAVNSYSNALLTLLMSNQFVEIKGTVFKKFEKENMFQLTCADVVERFQLWLMLLIIALRNIVEVGGLSISLSSVIGGSSTAAESMLTNATSIPLSSGFVVPKAFTMLPTWTGEVLGPFLIVLGSEALVDWCKHAYINKFNNIKPNIYGRFLDVLAKDYYTHAFGDQDLTKRLGLPVLPLSCLFIRACMQTYHMFLATHVSSPAATLATSISVESHAGPTTPATTAALQHVDYIFRRALGRSSFGAGGDAGAPFNWWSIDDIIAFATMCFFFLALWLILLALKLVLGTLLLSYSRNRYESMREREHQAVDTHAQRVGRYATIEVNDEKKRWIYRDDPDGLRQSSERAERGRKKGDMELDDVQRYTMAARSKRIW